MRTSKRIDNVVSSELYNVTQAPKRVPPTTVTRAVSIGAKLTECILTATFAVLVGLAMMVYCEPAKEVTTPEPLAARVIAPPPTDVTMLSTAPLTDVTVAKTGPPVGSPPWDCSQVDASERPSSRPEEAALSPTAYQEAAADVASL